MCKCSPSNFVFCESSKTRVFRYKPKDFLRRNLIYNSYNGLATYLNTKYAGTLIEILRYSHGFHCVYHVVEGVSKLLNESLSNIVHISCLRP